MPMGGQIPCFWAYPKAAASGVRKLDIGFSSLSSSLTPCFRKFP